MLCLLVSLILRVFSWSEPHHQQSRASSLQSVIGSSATITTWINYPLAYLDTYFTASVSLDNSDILWYIRLSLKQQGEIIWHRIQVYRTQIKRHKKNQRKRSKWYNCMAVKATSQNRGKHERFYQVRHLNFSLLAFTAASK